MSPRHPLLLAASGLLCAASLHAAEPAAAEPAKPAAPVEAARTEPPVEPYQLKNRSSFNCAAADTRAPFWPIGWVQRKGTVTAVAQAAAPTSALDEKNYKVTSILLGAGPTSSLAVINGRAYSEGEFLRNQRAVAAVAAAAKSAVPAANRVRVQRITDGSVVLQRAEETITVLLQRPELAVKKTEELTLDEER